MAEHELPVSAVRRYSSLAILFALFGITAVMAVRDPELTLPARIALGGLALGWLAGLAAVHTLARGALRLERDRLTSSDGRLSVSYAEIERVERGAFAMKPSNGAMLRLSRRYPARWAPGVWWQLGRRVGIGGLTPKAATRVWLDRLEAEIARNAAYRPDEDP